MEAILDFLFSAISGVLYILALGAVLFLFNRCDALLDLVKENINDTPLIYEQRKEEPETDTIAYQKLCTALLGDLEHDISIDGQEILAADYDYMLYDFSALRKTEYSMEYVYSEKGDIIKIVYTSR